LKFLNRYARYTETLMGKTLADQGHTLRTVATAARVTKYDVSNYLHGRKKAMSKEHRKRLHEWMVAAGLEKPRKRHVPHCARCGLQYPSTIKGVTPCCGYSLGLLLTCSAPSVPGNSLPGATETCAESQKTTERNTHHD
jgi:hypothetical protein